ncbi:hypothetical protein PISMIDRAFT_621764 [Pisolithus microcarpus 441]|uniref:Uncharacterized protein n=1 Tax=Pisolithus microcarpus 441 TaxID=765257 RepID=A0A0C9Z035_9AGAM|nr:hypothetical protein PISMIDRAFT_621764 [Pisolithus microcarpus 441]
MWEAWSTLRSTDSPSPHPLAFAVCIGDEVDNGLRHPYAYELVSFYADNIFLLNFSPHRLCSSPLNFQTQVSCGPMCLISRHVFLGCYLAEKTSICNQRRG